MRGSFRDGTPIYCPLRRPWSSVFTPFHPGIELRAVTWQSITLPLHHASSTFILELQYWMNQDLNFYPNNIILSTQMLSNFLIYWILNLSLYLKKYVNNLYIRMPDTILIYNLNMKWLKMYINYNCSVCSFLLLSPPLYWYCNLSISKQNVYVYFSLNAILGIESIKVQSIFPRGLIGINDDAWGADGLSTSLPNPERYRNEHDNGRGLSWNVT